MCSGILIRCNMETIYKSWRSETESFENIIFNCDCINGMNHMPDNSVDLIVTDPPYKTITGGTKDGAKSDRPKGVLSKNKNLFKYQNGICIKSWIGELYRVLREGKHCYIFTNSLNIKEMLIEAENAGFKLHNVLVWEKNNCTPSQFYMKNCEYILFFRKGKAKWINDIGRSKTVHSFKNIIGNKFHPTQKPVELLEFYITNSSEKGDIVFDPFIGSGSTALAALHTGRKFIGYEIDEKYYQIACQRVDQERKG